MIPGAESPPPSQFNTSTPGHAASTSPGTGAVHLPATIAGFAFSPLTAAAYPEINTVIAHLREVLSDQSYESLARNGESMTPAAMVTYAYDQIDQARAELNAV